MTRTHVVTGAGSGIGGAIAGLLHDRGDRLVLLARSAGRAAELESAFPGARTVVADLADPDALEATLADSDLPDAVDSVLHVAGVVELSPVADQPLTHWRETLDVNLLAPVVLTRALLPALRAARGTVVFVNSGAGLAAHPTWGSYAASKFGLRALADAIRAEEADQGIRVTTVFPGRVATPMQQKVHEQEGKEYDAGDWIRPETVAETIRHVLDLPDDASVPEVAIRPGPRG